MQEFTYSILPTIRSMTLVFPKGPPSLHSFPTSVATLTVSLAIISLLLFLSSSLPTLQAYFADRTTQFKNLNPDGTNDASLEHKFLGSAQDLIEATGGSSAQIKAPGSNNTSVIVPPPYFSDRNDGEAKMEKEIENPAPLVNDLSEARLSSNVDHQSLDSEDDLKSPEILNSSETNYVASANNSDDCDLYHGEWFYDPYGPLYRNDSCPLITQMQNCQANGRPDKDYENWRWRPKNCELPRFDAKEFLELMRGKTFAFVGDSVARNQMESLLCMLWQAEVPKNRGNRKMHRWHFKSSNVMMVRIWSSWLVRLFTDAFDFAPADIDKLHLDQPDQTFMELLPTFDVVILSSGHWFAKKSVYILHNEIVGGQLWWPDPNRKMKVNNVGAYEISVETILTAIVTHPNYTGIAIVRSYSPDHYEGGAWNTGGSCTGNLKPLAGEELVKNEYTETMHAKQVNGFQKAVKKATNQAKLRLMDVTEAFRYRVDGHPGPYRSPDPNKLTKRGPDGKPPPQDCLHWCMPGAVDTWNELVLEILRREFKHGKT